MPFCFCLKPLEKRQTTMNRKASIFLAIVIVLAFRFINVAIVMNREDLYLEASNSNGIELLRYMSFGSVPSSGSTSGSITSPSSQPKQEGRDHLGHDDGDFTYTDEVETTKLRGPHGSTSDRTKAGESLAAKDLARAQNNYGKMTEIRHRNPISRLNKDKDQPKLHLKLVNASTSQESEADGLSGTLMATLRYGVILGFEVYFIDVYIGTPPQHLPLILDTGSDLIWIQCATCPDCFEQSSPYYDPEDSTSFQEISCHDPLCLLVSDPDPLQCRESKNQSCPYIYLYGDSSNTTGNFAFETFTVNLTARASDTEFARVGNVMFGCGRWNGGISDGAPGMLGLGRGPLSLASQFHSLNGQSFSYCLANRHSNPNASSRLVLGEADGLLGRPGWNFTSFLGAQESPDSTYYYVKIKSIMVGGEILDIPRETWEVSPDGHGGTIIDSGTSLSYFVGPAYKAIREAFERKVKAYPMVEEGDFHPCYNVSGVSKPEIPGFGIEFVDGAAWSFPVENYFIPVAPDGIVCLAMVEKDEFPGSSIIGNYLQQDFHMWFDMKKSRLGYAAMRCADV
ncbi:aspartic proteinase nepenthesin-2-like [Rhodamnia argentea]|uniref:Aspartic proteinase nepenthesin-2-like n=1 Tax=Rhodamnia argentea TaxID=178133 RepID=A0ABM3HZ43_9MYRT|nr:aspartic proteinase nepenthesin-2-like [Rhodamnia argentea]